MNQNNKIELTTHSQLSKNQKEIVTELQHICFPDVDANEANEDFYHQPSVNVLAHSQGSLIGWAGVHITRQTYMGQSFFIGGYGICVHPNWRRKGIASKIITEAINFLSESKCDLGFLSVDPDDTAAIKLHQKFGFVMLTQPFSWTNSKGEVKKDLGGMIAAIHSKQLFNKVLDGTDTLYVGNGYW